MTKKNRADYIFQDAEGEVLIKKPGAIAGNGFVIERLQNCEVYLLDHTSQVQIDDCVNCKILVGPCDGSVFVRDCSDCLIIAAARQLRTRDCKNLELSLYCPTQPSIETSLGLKVTCWRGAYPNLIEHFKAANLDPAVNTWDQVFNFNSKDPDAHTHYTVDYHPYPFVEVPVEGLGPCENPVPHADGSTYTPGGATQTDDASEGSAPVVTVGGEDAAMPVNGIASHENLVKVQEAATEEPASMSVQDAAIEHAPEAASETTPAQAVPDVPPQETPQEPTPAYAFPDVPPQEAPQEPTLAHAFPDVPPQEASPEPDDAPEYVTAQYDPDAALDDDAPAQSTSHDLVAEAVPHEPLPAYSGYAQENAIPADSGYDQEDAIPAYPQAVPADVQEPMLAYAQQPTSEYPLEATRDHTGVTASTYMPEETPGHVQDATPDFGLPSYMQQAATFEANNGPVYMQETAPDNGLPTYMQQPATYVPKEEAVYTQDTAQDYGLPTYMQQAAPAMHVPEGVSEGDDARATWSATNNRELQGRTAKEAAAKEEQLAAAAAARKKQDEARAAAIAARKAANREAEAAAKEAAGQPTAGTLWERVIALLDPLAKVPKSDCATFKAVLTACRVANKAVGNSRAV